MGKRAQINQLDAARFNLLNGLERFLHRVAQAISVKSNHPGVCVLSQRNRPNGPQLRVPPEHVVESNTATGSSQARRTKIRPANLPA